MADGTGHRVGIAEPGYDRRHLVAAGEEEGRTNHLIAAEAHTHAAAQQKGWNHPAFLLRGPNENRRRITAARCPARAAGCSSRPRNPSARPSCTATCPFPWSPVTFIHAFQSMI